MERLVGSWTFTMQHTAVAEPITGTQSYHRVLDGAFLQLDWSYEHPDFPDAIVFYGTDRVHHFDVRGVARVFELRTVSSGWYMIRRDDDFWQRSAAHFVDDDTIESVGENSFDDGATWQHDFTMEYRRVR